LVQEADTTSNWDKSVVSRFLSMKPAATDPNTLARPSATDLPSNLAALVSVALSWASELDRSQLTRFAEFRKTNKTLPPDLDGKLLAKAREALGRDLEPQEKRTLRAAFVDAVKLQDPKLFEP